MHHLDEVAGSYRPDMAVALIGGRGQGLENRLQAAKGIGLAANHQGITLGQTPDAAAGADIHQLNAIAGQLFALADSVLVVGIAAIQNHIPGGKQGNQLVDGGVGNLAGGQHQPHGPGRRQQGGHFVQAGRAIRALVPAGGDRGAAGIVSHHAVPAAEQPLRHIAAHPTQANHCQFHKFVSRIWVMPDLPC